MQSISNTHGTKDNTHANIALAPGPRIALRDRIMPRYTKPTINGPILGNNINWVKNEAISWAVPPGAAKVVDIKSQSYKNMYDSSIATSLYFCTTKVATTRRDDNTNDHAVLELKKRIAPIPRTRLFGIPCLIEILTTEQEVATQIFLAHGLVIGKFF